MFVERNLIISILKLTKSGPIDYEIVRKDARIPKSSLTNLLKKMQNEGLLYLCQDKILAVGNSRLKLAYRALALGATHWQTIHHVLLPAARRGIIAAIILGTGRAIGETMAMIMVIGNSPIFPANIFGPARTLTGNIAVEIAAATGIHESALFATGLVLFILVMLINSIGSIAYRRRA